MQTAELRASAVNVALPFRTVWSRWGGVIEPADRAQAVFLYRGVFNPERWIPAPEEGEDWIERDQESETWVARTVQAEAWTPVSSDAEVWIERTKQSEGWTNKPDH